MDYIWNFGWTCSHISTIALENENLKTTKLRESILMLINDFDFLKPITVKYIKLEKI